MLLIRTSAVAQGRGARTSYGLKPRTILLLAERHIKGTSKYISPNSLLDKGRKVRLERIGRSGFILQHTSGLMFTKKHLAKYNPDDLQYEELAQQVQDRRLCNIRVAILELGTISIARTF
jgi:hypothetical protein